MRGKPHLYQFGDEVGVDVFEAAETHGIILGAVDMGTTSDLAWIARTADKHGSPSSSACLKAFDQGLVRWAG